MTKRLPAGQAQRGGPPLRPIADRFWDKVIQHSEGCWGWTGKPDKDGYGELTGGRYADRTLHRVRAHRLSWELHNGPIPEGMWVLHHCDNPPCTNPDHLYLGTAVENGRDVRVRKRQPSIRRTHCNNGHEFTPANTHYERASRTGELFRRCRRCSADRAMATKRRKKELLTSGIAGEPSK